MGDSIWAIIGALGTVAGVIVSVIGIVVSRSTQTPTSPSPTPTSPPPTPRWPGRIGRWAQGKIILVVLAVLLLAIVAAGGVYAFNGISTSDILATVTIEPRSESLSRIDNLVAVTNKPDVSKRQVQARLLSANTSKYSLTVSASGQKYQAATQASGIIQIWPGYSPEVWNKGTVFHGALKSGGYLDIVVPTDVGTISVATNLTATAVVAGAVGNFSNGPNHPWQAISCTGSPPCTDGSTWSAYSNGPFAGGSDAQTYSIVQQSDIDSAENSLISANQPDPQQVLQARRLPNEVLVGTPRCTPTKTADHRAGDRAATITVYVSFVCAGEFYDHDGAVQLAASLLSQQAQTDFGEDYTLAGTISVTVASSAVDKQGNIALTTSSMGRWTFRFSNDQQRILAQLVAGKRVDEAQQLLSAQPGVSTATIQFRNGGTQTLPSDASKIRIVVI